MIGELIGHYRIESLIGVGGMGELYLATTVGAAKGNTAAKTAGHGQGADGVGDICLLPDIARFAH